ncbi:MAG: cellulase family glycosylhydrolase [Promethearchaeota archaeon]
MIYANLIAFIGIIIPIIVIKLVVKNKPETCQRILDLTPFFLAMVGILYFFLWLELNSLKNASTTPVMYFLVYTLVPVVGIATYLIFSNCIILLRAAKNFSKQKESNHSFQSVKMTIIMGCVFASFSFISILSTKIILFWEDAAPTIYSSICFVASCISFVYHFLDSRIMSTNQYLVEIHRLPESRSGKTYRFFTAFLAVVIVTVSGMLICGAFSYISDNYWYYQPMDSHLALKYPKTIYFGRTFMGMGSLLVSIFIIMMSIILFVFLKKRRDFHINSIKGYGFNWLLACTIIQMMAAGLYLGLADLISNQTRWLVASSISGIGLALFFVGLLIFTSHMHSKPVVVYILSIFLPFSLNVTPTFPSQKSGAQIETIGVWLLIGSFIAMVLLLTLLKKLFYNKRLKDIGHFTIKDIVAAKHALIFNIYKTKKKIMIACFISIFFAIYLAGNMAFTNSRFTETKIKIAVSSGRAINKPFGFNCHITWGSQYTDFRVDDPVDLENMKKLNVGWIRSDFWWGALFPNDSGVPNSDFVRYIDDFVANTSSIGIKIDCLLSYGTSWACPEDPFSSGWYNTYPHNLTAWRDYMSFCSGRWQGNSSMGYFEIYNEPNNPRYWSSSKESLKLFANLTVEAARTIKAMDPSALVFGPGLSGVGLDSILFRDTHDEPNFLSVWVENADESARDVGMTFGDLFDGFCCHPYGLWQSQVSKYQILNEFVSSQEKKFGRSFLRLNTETGTPTSEPDSPYDVQAMQIAKYMVVSQLLGYDVYINYEYRDANRLPENYNDLDRADLDGEWFFGVVNNDRQPKPSFYAFGTISNLLSEGFVLTPFSNNPENSMGESLSQSLIFHSAFKSKNGTTVLILWHEGEGVATANLDLGFDLLIPNDQNDVFIYDPADHDDRMWLAHEIPDKDIEINSNHIFIKDVCVSRNLTIIEIKNPSTLVNYALTMPKEYSLLINVELGSFSSVISFLSITAYLMVSIKRKSN